MTPAPCTIAAPSPRRRRAASNPDEITPRRLEVLVRLHRRDLDGAGAELLDALDTRRDELADAIGVATTALPMPGGREQLSALVALIEGRVAQAKAARAGTRLVEAERLAGIVAGEAVVGFDGIELDHVVLAELAGVTGYDTIVFSVGSEPIGVSRTLVASVLREVGGVELTSLRVVAEEQALRVGYYSKRCTGWLRLLLEPPDTKRVCVVVDLDAVRSYPVPEDDVVYSPAHTWTDPRPRGPFAQLAGGAP